MVIKLSKPIFLILVTTSFVPAQHQVHSMNVKNNLKLKTLI